mmetsp:Transcript_23524/g.56096  ORF Transcript_23524/g.56096 Transcript_23524/m.56096 type:complete len:206 (-) Transcript_23524:2908-3525(-)
MVSAICVSPVRRRVAIIGGTSASSSDRCTSTASSSSSTTWRESRCSRWRRRRRSARSHHPKPSSAVLPEIHTMLSPDAPAPPPSVSLASRARVAWLWHAVCAAEWMMSGGESAPASDATAHCSLRRTRLPERREKRRQRRRRRRERRERGSAQGPRGGGGWEEARERGKRERFLLDTGDTRHLWLNWSSISLRLRTALFLSLKPW